MKIEGAFLHSRVARRVFTLFICCAILPITALAAISYGVVTAQLMAQSRQNLKQASKAVGMAILERLTFLEAELRRVEADPTFARAASRREGIEAHAETLRRFKAVTLLADTGRETPLYGRIDSPLEISPAEREALRSDKTFVVSRFPAGESPRVFMVRRIAPATSARAFLVGEVNTEYLWGTADENPLPPQTEFCLLEPPDRVFVCTTETPSSVLKQAASPNPLTYSVAVQFEWTGGGEEYLASAWTLFLRSSFNAPPWIVVLSQAKSEVLSPLSGFKKVFPPVIVISLCVVILLSVAQIRRSLVPLEQLQEGTRRIAQRDFDSQVAVTSGDEFEDLAASFNLMSRRLGSQFRVLSTIGEVTQVVLSSLETRRIVETVLGRMKDVCPCDRVGIILAGRDETSATLYVGNGVGGESLRGDPVRLAPADVQFLRDHPRTVTRDHESLPSYLAPWADAGLRSVVLLPILLGQRLAAIIALGYLEAAGPDPDDQSHARQLVDQVAVALANARLIEDLDRLNWGTLNALARAIDAKSPWTAGHSERVTDLALQIGQTLNLGPQRLAVLHRGGLLHDLGKLGIPPEILDKPGRLTPEETRIMQGHVTLGARILEPIAAYAEVIPILLQHHESFDGSGYPVGLAGEAIDLGARIFGVADVFDALLSDRPYRRGLDREEVIRYIRDRSGRQFDPRVVEAFLEVMTRQRSGIQAKAQEEGVGRS